MDDNYIIDNKAISLKDQIIKYSNVSSEAKIASGYFYINGYRLVSEAFQSLNKVQIVIGNELSVDVKEDELISCKDYLERKMLEDLEKEEDENLKKKVREIYNLLNSKKIDIRAYYTDGSSYDYKEAMKGIGVLDHTVYTFRAVSPGTVYFTFKCNPRSGPCSCCDRVVPVRITPKSYPMGWIMKKFGFGKTD